MVADNRAVAGLPDASPAAWLVMLDGTGGVAGRLGKTRRDHESLCRCRLACRPQASSAGGPSVPTATKRRQHNASGALRNTSSALLTTRDFDLLHAVMLNAGRVMSREQLEQQLYSWGYEVESNAIEAPIHHLRRKLNPDVIQTVRGVGYTVPRGQAPA